MFERKINFFLGLCGRKQKEISKAIKKAHALGEFTFLCILINFRFHKKCITETIGNLQENPFTPE